MKKIAVGVDIGGTNTTFGLVDELGNVVKRGSIQTPKENNARKFVQNLAAEIKILIGSLTESADLIGIGIGAPNANYYTGNIEEAPNLAFKGVVPFVDMMKTEFPAVKKIAITNDANAAAMGEMIYGGARGMKNFVMVTLGTGLGSGFVVNGELVYGSDGFAGELGHVTVAPDGRMCGCGQLGHLETYCSATGMVRTAFELLAHHNASDSALANKTFNQLTSKDIYEAAKKDDEVALQVFEITGDILGQALANTAHICSPEAFFLFGGPVAAGELLFGPTRESMESNLMPIFKNKIKILPSKLRLGDAAIVGASALVANA
jgi:glucokinase